MNILIMTVGLPQSGKSTWARSQIFPIVCPDSIRLGLHGHQFVSQAEPFVWAIAKVMVRSLFLSGHGTVILDATNVTKKRRDDWVSESWTRTFKEFRTSKEICVERALKTFAGHDNLDGVLAAIDRMSKNLEWVDNEECDCKTQV